MFADLSRGSEKPDLCSFLTVLEAAAKLLESSHDTHSILDICRGFSYLSDGDNSVKIRFFTRVLSLFWQVTISNLES